MSPLILRDRPFVVVGLDGSPCSKQALRWALREARRSGAAVHVVRVWSDPWAVTGPPSLVGAGREGLVRLQDELARWVDEAVEAEEAGDVPIVEDVLPGDPADVLARESQAALMLVVGRRGLGRVGRWLLGSVSQRCAQQVHVPLALVPESDRCAEPSTV